MPGMHADPHRPSNDSQVRVASRLFVGLHESRSAQSAERLIEWLRQSPQHVQAFDEALTLWAVAGAALLFRPPQEEGGGVDDECC
jgi:ferric-dicitrate binding protein FerR (iron transport regulator)